MRVVTFKRIKDFSEKHPDAENPLYFWYHSVKSKDWESLNDIRKDYNSVDYVGNHRYIFNIKGNAYRLIAIISFNAKKVYIRFIGSHSDYAKITDIKNI